MNHVCCSLHLSEGERPLIGLYHFLEVPRNGEIIFINNGTHKGHYVVENICHVFADEYKLEGTIPYEASLKVYMKKIV